MTHNNSIGNPEFDPNDPNEVTSPDHRENSKQDLTQRSFDDQLDIKTSLEHWLQLDEATFRKLYRHTPFWRTKLSGMQRNAMIAAANSNRQDLKPIVEKFLNSSDEVLQSTCHWCMKKLNACE